MRASAPITCSCSFMIWCLIVSLSSPAVRGGEWWREGEEEWEWREGREGRGNVGGRDDRSGGMEIEEETMEREGGRCVGSIGLTKQWGWGRKVMTRGRSG